MNASIRSKIAAVTVALVASAGFATSSVSAASAESDGQRAVEVQTDGTVIEYVVTNGDVWRTSAESPEQASAVELQSDGTYDLTETATADAIDPHPQWGDPSDEHAVHARSEHESRLCSSGSVCLVRESSHQARSRWCLRYRGRSL